MYLSIIQVPFGSLDFRTWMSSDDNLMNKTGLNGINFYFGLLNH
jgi:hypothetical protein